MNQTLNEAQPLPEVLRPDGAVVRLPDLEAEAVIGRAPATPFRRVRGSVLLARPGRRDLERLEGVAAAVWLVLDRPRAVASIVRVVEAGAPEDGAGLAVLEAVDHLRTIGIVGPVVSP